MSLNSNRTVSGQDVKSARNINQNKFETFSKLLKVPEGLTRQEVEALTSASFSIDMGDGTTVSANTKRQEPDLAIKGDAHTRVARGYAEPPAEAANGQKSSDHWSPSKGDLDTLDPSSWSKLQMYACDVGRASGWDSKHNHHETNALRHALHSLMSLSIISSINEIVTLSA